MALEMSVAQNDFFTDFYIAELNFKINSSHFCRIASFAGFSLSMMVFMISWKYKILPSSHISPSPKLGMSVIHFCKIKDKSFNLDFLMTSSRAMNQVIFVTKNWT